MMFNSAIDPSRLFSTDILDYPVQTSRYGLTRYVNLDNAATTPPLRAVEAAVHNYLVAYGSVHRGAGTKSKVSTDAYEHARDVIKDFVNAPADSYVIFAGNTTGAMNAAAYFFSFLSGKIAVSQVEHSSSWLPWIKAEGIKLFGARQVSLAEMSVVDEEIQRLGGQQVIRYRVNDGLDFDLASLESILVNNHVKVVVVTGSSNLTGYCPDMVAVADLAHRHGAYLLVDACQYLQHHPLDMQATGIDFLVASGHKFYAPYGGGFLIGPKDFLDEFLPYQIGGGNLPYITREGRFLRFHNQLAHDPGTPNAVGAIAMATALTVLKELGLENVRAYEQRLSSRLCEGLKAIPGVRLHVSSEHLSTVFPLSIEGWSAVEMAEALNDGYGIGVRAGSFCVYEGVRKLLRVTDEAGIIAAVESGDATAVPALVRASIGLDNLEQDIDRFLEALAELTG